MEGVRNILTVLDLVIRARPTVINLQETWLRSESVSYPERTIPGYHWVCKTADEHLLVEERLILSNLSYHRVATGVLSSISD